MMKSTSIVVTLFLLCSHVKADDVAASVEEGVQPPVIAPIKEGDVAPFEGTLFSTEAVAEIIAERRGLEAKIASAVEHAVDEADATCEAGVKKVGATAAADAAVAQAKLDAALKKSKILEDELKTKERRSKMQKVWIAVSGVAGLLVAGVVVGLSVKESR